MLPIYLLEDDEVQRNNYSEFINNSIMINASDMELKLATDTTEELFNSCKNETKGLFFLDMEIAANEIAGLEAAEKIKQAMPLAQIVFITTHDELTLITLERRIAPLDYIIKNKGMDSIKKSINNDIALAQHYFENFVHHSRNLLNYKIGSRFFSVLMDDVIMLFTETTSPGRVTFITKNQRGSFMESLNSLETKYPNLFRCDRSYLVNLDNAKAYDSKSRILTFIDHSTCKVSFRKSRELMNSLEKKLK
ncbi:response regulator transcription factor [Companilactobacillus allii]|uniref:DNA-binding response regulator n=1 Tax=Companilactobacillus allii TaxID=1847728 RepID=A0A1P8Q2U0_9LACO|nr:response regulator transcription factor [Companilactobacillus allii]APX72137.1 DNA-binding response regulator [Companilactobacillus allii]USQ69235.1 response regulator transcription factor [Companilactobacillus allii]